MLPVDQTLEDLQDAASERGSETGFGPSHQDVPDPKSVTYTDYDDPWSLAHDASGSPHIAKLSQNAWVTCGKDVYLLECLGKGHIRIEPGKQSGSEGPKFVATFTPAALSKKDAAEVGMQSRFFRKRDVLTAESLEAAVKGCDTFAVNKVVFGSLGRG